MVVRGPQAQRRAGRRVTSEPETQVFSMLLKIPNHGLLGAKDRASLCTCKKLLADGSRRQAPLRSSWYAGRRILYCGF